MIDLAIEVAARAHRHQVRKNTDIPYITHPFAVGMLLAKAGCSEEAIAAGILHDTIEDTPLTLNEIRKHFGDRVALIVEGCSEPDKSLPWEDRKRHTIEFLKTAPREVRLVSCADKLHNVRTLVADHQRIGDEVWSSFKRGREEQEWYYRGLVEILCDRPGDRPDVSLFRDFKREVGSLFGEE